MNETTLYEVGQRISWTLVHSLWQFALIALMLAIALRLMRGRSPHGRYSFMLVAMTVMVIASVVTFFTFSPEAEATKSRLVGVQESEVSQSETILASGELHGPLTQLPVTPSIARDVQSQVLNHRNTEKGLSVHGLRARSVSVVQSLVQEWMNTIVVCWFCGIVLLSFRPLIGWRATRTLMSRARTPVSDSIQMATIRVAKRLSVRRAIEIAQSAHVDVPVVIGWLKPIVLLPASTISGLSTQQLEVIIAHELAHVRRYDYLVNLFQLVMETLFFYHLAVWWLSQRMRVEREDCCDEIAAGLTGDRVGYAKLLVWLEETRQQPAKQTLAMSAADGSLLKRVRRLLSSPAETSGIGPLAIAAVVTFVLVASFILAINDSSSFADKPVSASDDRRTVQVSDTLSVKLVAVLPLQAPAEEAWRPNGDLFEKAPLLPKMKSNSQHQSMSGIDYVFMFEGLADDQYPTYKTNGSESWRHPWDDGYSRLETQPPAEQKLSTVEVGIPDEDWGVWVAVNVDGELVAPAVVQPKLQNAYKIVRVNDARARGDHTMLRWAFDRDERDVAAVEVVAVDNEGNRTTQWASTLWDDEDGVTRRAEVFNLPIGKVSHFQYRLRPYRHWITFQNVSLQPGQKTNFKTSVETIAIPPTSNKATFSGRIVMPDGTPGNAEGYMYYQSQSKLPIPKQTTNPKANRAPI